MTKDRRDHPVNPSIQHLNSFSEQQPMATAPSSVVLVEDENTGDRFLLYTTEAGIQVRLAYEGDQLWMSQAQIAELFGRDISRISRHISNIFEEGELNEETSLRKAQTTQGRPSVLYSLDMVISVGYRVSSRQGTLFRKWATAKLVQFATKGFVVDSERLKSPEARDHFQDLKEIIRDIRASEYQLYKEVRRICALCSDYESLTDQDKYLFFATVQNKLHYAVTGMTGAEIRMQRADAKRDHMGLVSWTGNHPTQRDALTAKNYLGEPEIRDLNRFTSMLLDYFEQETDLQRLVVMQDAEQKLDRFIQNNERPLLMTAGSVSKSQADEHTKQQYNLYKEHLRRLAHEQSLDED